MVSLALRTRKKFGQPAGATEVLQQRLMGLEDAASVRAPWQRQRELERVLEHRLEIEPVTAEAQREREHITKRLRQSPWLTRQGADRCARAVAGAIQRLHTHLDTAVNADGNPARSCGQFAMHLHEHLLLTSDRGDRDARADPRAPPGCLIYAPPQGVSWSVECRVRSAASKCRGSRFRVQGSKFGSPQPKPRRPAAVIYLSRFLCAGFVMVLLATARCAGPRSKYMLAKGGFLA